MQRSTNEIGLATEETLLDVLTATQAILAELGTGTPHTAASPTFATVGTSSGTVLAANASRKGLVLVNTSINIIYLSFGVTAVVNSGITLTPYGSFVMDELTLSTAQINGIASGASSNLAIQEYS